MSIVSPARRRKGPQRSLVSVPAVQSLPEREGCGSTLIAYDLDLDTKSNLKLAFSPKKLDHAVSKLIANVGMIRRGGFLDPFETLDWGPSTSFHSISESHQRVAIIDFSRTETWPVEKHVNGEAQLCDFSRDNSGAARQLVDSFIDALDPVSVQLLVIRRGPGTALVPLQRIVWERGGRIRITKY